WQTPLRPGYRAAPAMHRLLLCHRRGSHAPNPGRPRPAAPGGQARMPARKGGLMRFHGVHRIKRNRRPESTSESISRSPAPVACRVIDLELRTETNAVAPKIAWLPAATDRVILPGY